MQSDRQSQAALAGMATGIGAPSKLSSGGDELKALMAPTELPQRQALSELASASKVNAKQFPEMEAFVRLIKGVLGPLFDPEVNAYSDYDADSSTKKSWVKATAMSTGWRWLAGTSQIKTASPAMKSMPTSRHHNIVKLIENFLKVSGCKSDEITQPTVKSLTTFILDGMIYMFLGIEIKFETDPKQKLLHYNKMQELCLHLISSDKWGVEYSSLINLFSSSQSSAFRLFMHKLLLALDAKLKTTQTVIEPQKMTNLTADLEAKIGNGLLSLKEMLLKSTSQLEPPVSILHDEETIELLRTKDPEHIARSNLDKNVKNFFGSEKRIAWLQGAFFPQQHEESMKSINQLANASAQLSLEYHPANTGSESTPFSIEHLEAGQEQKGELVTTNTSITPSSRQMARSSEARENLTLLTQNEQKKYAEFRQKKLQVFLENVIDSMPEPIRAALQPPKLTDSLAVERHKKARHFISTIMELCVLMDSLEVNHILADSIKNYVARSGPLGDWTVAGDFQNMKQNLMQLSGQLLIAFEAFVTSSFRLRTEMKSMNKTQWGRNIDSCLGDVHSVRKDLRLILQALPQIENGFDLSEKYNELVGIVNQRERIRVQQMVLFGEISHVHIVDKAIIAMAQIAKVGMQTQAQLTQHGGKSSDYYVRAALEHKQAPNALDAPQQMSLTGPNGGEVADEKQDARPLLVGNITKVREVSLADLNNALLPNCGLTLKDVLEGSIYQENRDTAFLDLKGKKQRFLLDPNAIERVRAMQNPAQPQMMYPQPGMMVPTAPVRSLEVTLEDIITNNLGRHNLTLMQVLNAEFSEKQGQAFLTVTENEISRKFMLAQNAKQSLLVLKAAIRASRPVAPTTTVLKTSSNPTLEQAKVELATLEAEIIGDAALRNEKVNLRDEKSSLRLEKEKLRVEKHLRLSMIQVAQPQLDRSKDVSAKLARGWVAATLIGLPLFIIAQLYRFAKRGSIAASQRQYNENAVLINALTMDTRMLATEVATLTTEMTTLNNANETIHVGLALKRTARNGLIEKIKNLQSSSEQKGQPTPPPAQSEVKRPQQAPTLVPVPVPVPVPVQAPTPLTVVVTEPVATPASQPAAVSASVAQAAATPLPLSPTVAPVNITSPKGSTQTSSNMFTPASPASEDKMVIEAMKMAKVQVIINIGEQAARKMKPADLNEASLKKTFTEAAFSKAFQSSFPDCQNEHVKKDLANDAYEKFMKTRLAATGPSASGAATPMMKKG